MARKRTVSDTASGTDRVLFGTTLQQSLKHCRMSQAALADILGVSRNTVNNWIGDKYKPEHEQIVRICSILGITLNELYGYSDKDELSRAEKNIIRNYRMLSETNKRTVEKIVYDILDEELAEQDRYLKSSFRLIEMPKTKAAAGQGSDYMDVPADHVFIRKNDCSRNADAIIAVSGDSMLPIYHDGDLVYVEYTDTALPGEDVICTTADGGVIKRVTAENRLQSVNPLLPFGDKGEDDNVRIIGRVLGIVDSSDHPTPKELVALNELFANELRMLE